MFLLFGIGFIALSSLVKIALNDTGSAIHLALVAIFWVLAEFVYTYRGKK